MKTILFATLMYATTAFSQVTISHENIPLNGAVYVHHHAAHEIEVDHGSDGPNQTWSFTDYEWMDEEVMEIIEVDHTPFAEDFPTATRSVFYPAPERHGDGSYYFERIASDGMFSLGFGNVTDTDTIPYHYVNETLQCPLPLSFPSAEWVTVERWWFSFSPGDTVVIVDSMRSHVDGWGTVNTSFGLHDCLRIFHHDWLFTYMPGIPPVEIEQVGYIWFDENCIARADVTSEADVVDPNFLIGHLHVVSDALDTPPIRGPVANHFSVSQNYPNPFNPTTQLPVNIIAGGEVSLKIYNEIGQLVSEQSFALSPGRYDLPIDGSNWTSGNYFANISANGSEFTKKLQLVR